MKYRMLWQIDTSNLLNISSPMYNKINYKFSLQRKSFIIVTVDVSILHIILFETFRLSTRQHETMINLFTIWLLRWIVKNMIFSMKIFSVRWIALRFKINWYAKFVRRRKYSFLFFSIMQIHLILKINKIQI